MDTLVGIASWYEANAFLLTPLFASIGIMGFALWIFQMIGDRYLRFPMLLITGIALLVISFVPSAYARELYLNLSMQFFMALVALLLVGFAEQQQGWGLPVLVVAVPAVLLQFFTPADNTGSNIPVTLGTTLIGAVIVAFMLRQEWAWSPARQEKRLSAAMRKARQEQAELDADFGDFFMLISGHDEETIEQRIDFLKDHDMSLVHDNPVEYDEFTETYFRLINVQIDTVVKDQETVYLNNAETRMQILGYPDALKRVYKQLGEVLVTRDQKRIETPEAHLAHIEFKVDVPQKMYSTLLEEKLYALARDWQYGDDEHLQHATEPLIQWAKAEGLVN